MQTACTSTWPHDFLHIIHVIQEEQDSPLPHCGLQWQNPILHVSERKSSGLACVAMTKDYIPLDVNVILHVAFCHSQQLKNIIPDTVCISEWSMKF